MGYADKLKELRSQAVKAVADNHDKIVQGIDTAATKLNEQTEGKYEDKLTAYGTKAVEAVNKVAEQAPPADEQS
jgi:hypothetical protein